LKFFFFLKKYKPFNKQTAKAPEDPNPVPCGTSEKLLISMPSLIFSSFKDSLIILCLICEIFFTFSYFEYFISKRFFKFSFITIVIYLFMAAEITNPSFFSK
jgi:hypothetical protein